MKSVRLKSNLSPSAQQAQAARMKAQAGTGRPFVFNYCQDFSQFKALSHLEYWTANNKQMLQDPGQFVLLYMPARVGVPRGFGGGRLYTLQHPP